MDQLNVLTPNSPITEGPAREFVTGTPSGYSTGSDVYGRPVSPSSFKWGQYVVATHSKGSLVGLPGATSSTFGPCLCLKLTFPRIYSALLAAAAWASVQRCKIDCTAAMNVSDLNGFTT